MPAKETNWRLVVYPVLAYVGETQRDSCERLRSAINRHVDHGGMSLDSDLVCSYCGGKWTERGRTYNGGCCDDDERHNPAPEVGDE